MEFSFTRLGYLLKKQWVENQKFYLLGILAMIGIMALALLLPMSGGRGLTDDIQQGFMGAGMLILGFIFSTTLLNRFADKSKGIEALMLPASALEKVLSAVIYSLIFFPLVYFLTVYPLVILMHFIDIKVVGNINLLYHPHWERVEKGFLLGFLVLQSFSLLCSIMFRRYTFLKATVLVFIIFFSLNYLNSNMSRNLIKDLQPRNLTVQEKRSKIYTYTNESAYRSIYFRKFKSNDMYEVRLPDNQDLIFVIAGWLLIPFFWLLTWLKLRERQL